MKRSLAPRTWRPNNSDCSDGGRNTKVKGIAPLVEGPVFGAIEAQEEVRAPQGDEVRPYRRGSLDSAMQLIASSMEECTEHIRQKRLATTSKGPFESRKATWASLASRAGFSEPFCLQPSMIYAVMGAMDLAGYRSSELYLDTARQVHIEAGRPWTQQLAQASRQARRACQRGRGPAKQAQPLPFRDLCNLEIHKDQLANGGPLWPVRAMLLASWWLLREIEASAAKPSHVEVDETNRLVHWRLPSSKCDWQALGATRTHACNCGMAREASCPFHLMKDQLKSVRELKVDVLFPSKRGDESTKAGWSDTIQELAKKLGLAILTPSGARKFTGHSARATGAVFLAQTQVELWRIQLFGRWGSNVFQRYVREAPLTQLHHLSRETSVQTSLLAARAELAALIAKSKQDRAELPNAPLKEQPVEHLMDCEAAAMIAAPAPAPPQVQFVVNRSTYGKVHKVVVSGPNCPHFRWHTACHWYFARNQADYELVNTKPEHKEECSKCFKSRTDRSDDESTTSSSSSESRSALQVGN